MRVVALALLVGCGGADARSPEVASTPSLADARALGSLSSVEQAQWCAEETTLPPAIVTDLQVQQVECTVSALATLGDSADPVACELEVEECMAVEPGPRPCTLGTQPGNCRRATIGQLRACVREMQAKLSVLAERDLCTESRASDQAWWAAAGYLYGPACMVIARLCDA